MVQTQRTLHNSGRGGTERINPLELDRCAYAENERAIGPLACKLSPPILSGPRISCICQMNAVFHQLYCNLQIACSGIEMGIDGLRVLENGLCSVKGLTSLDIG